MDYKEYSNLRKTEEILRLRFNLSKEIVLYPMWLHPYFERWQHHWAAENDRYFKAVPGRRPREIVGQIDSDGYRQIIANSRTLLEQAHRIQFRLFSGTDLPDGHHVHHINGRRLDNSVLNLIALCPDEHRRLPRSPVQRMTVEERAQVIAMAEQGRRVADIARAFGKTQRQISNVLRNQAAKTARAARIAFSPISDQREGPAERPLYGLEIGSPGITKL